MVIRSRQLAQFGTVAMESFIARATDHCQRCFPDRLSAESCRAHVLECISVGQSYGLESEWAVIRYIDLTLALGKGFEQMSEYAAVAEVLRNSGLNERSKVTRAYAIVNNADKIE